MERPRRARAHVEGLALPDLAGPEAEENADLLVFPAWHSHFRPTPEPLAALIRRAHDRGALVACLHVVRTRLGSAAAAKVARRLVIAPHREGGQAQYIERPLPETEERGPIGELIEWALANLDADLGVGALAARARMSPCNFTRRFRETTGTSPAKWVNARRLDEARTLLETTSWSVAKISGACGFGNPVTFRQGFAAAYGTTPTSYRKRFTPG